MWTRPFKIGSVGLKAALYSQSKPAVWLLLQSIGVLQQIVNLKAALYRDSSSCVRVNGELNDFFIFHSSMMSVEMCSRLYGLDSELYCP